MLHHVHPQRRWLLNALASSVAVLVCATAMEATVLTSTGSPAEPDDRTPAERAPALLDNHVLITWYGNPNVARMGVLGEATGEERAAALRRQAAEYRGLTPKGILEAYHLIAVVAQNNAGGDSMWRRREDTAIIEELLNEAREHGFHFILDVQPGRSPIREELEFLRPFLKQPHVHLAIDPEWTMGPDEVPGEVIGSLRAADVNVALDYLEDLIREHNLPRKILILYQFTLGMLPDKENIRRSPVVELALVMDGIGTQALKLDSYNAVMNQGQLDYAGFKIFYDEDTDLFTPEQVLNLDPPPAVISYQ